MASFLDGTLSGIKDGEATSIASPQGLPPSVIDARRVIPMLLTEIATHTHSRQRLHVRLFFEHLSDFIEFGEATEDDYEMLLALLFCLMNRRGGLTHLQETINDEISDVSFQALHRLLAIPNAKTKDVLDAVDRLLQRLDCTWDQLFFQPESVPELSSELLAVNVPESEEEKKVKALREHQQDPPTAPVLPQKPESFAPSLDIFFMTVDCVPSERRGSLSETEFLLVEQWYHERDREATVEHEQAMKEVVVNPEEPAETSSSPQRTILKQWIERHPTVGLKRFGSLALHLWSADHPSGGGSLTDLLRFMYPDTADEVLLRRVAGHVMLDGVTEENGTPPNPLPHVEPQATVAANEILKQQKAGTFALTPVVVRYIVNWFFSMDFRSLGALPLEAIEASGAPLFFDPAKLVGKDTFTVRDVMSICFPGATAGSIRAVLDDVQKRQRALLDAQREFIAAENQKFAQQLQQSGPPGAVSTNEAGDLVTSLAPEVIDHLRARNAAIREHYKSCVSHEIRRIQLATQLKQLEQQRKHKGLSPLWKCRK